MTIDPNYTIKDTSPPNADPAPLDPSTEVAMAWVRDGDMPEDMKRDLRTFWTDLAKTHPLVAEAAARGKTSGFVPVTHEMYKPVLDAALEVRKTRKR